MFPEGKWTSCVAGKIETTEPVQGEGLFLAMDVRQMIWEFKRG